MSNSQNLLNKRNIVLTLAYDGTKYRGWQKQGNTSNTIQEKLEILLSRLLSENIEINGAGRTDAGVHAKGQVVNFITTSNMSINKMFEEINKYLPEDIEVVSVKEASNRFHSRLNASKKHYRYIINNSNKKDVFNFRYQYKLEDKLDVNAMKKASKYLLGEHDFKSFCGNKHMKKSTVRNIYDITFSCENGKIIIDYYGNGFLQYMIRIMTGTLIDVGLHNIKPESMLEIINAKSREAASGAAPAMGLCLIKVEY